MRIFGVVISCFLLMPPMAGCATLQSQDSKTPAVTMPVIIDVLRVRVLYTRSSARLSATGPFQYQSRRGGKVFTSQSGVRVHALRSALVFDSKSLKGDVLVFPVSSTDTLKLNGRRYRGVLVFHPSGSGRYDVVEYVNLDEYLYGVLPREVEPSWPLESLKAQAIVSRTYALSNKLTDARERFDVSNSVLDQVYGGREVEAPESNRAVDETRGEVLLDQAGKPVQAFFHSSCGGRTEFPNHVWAAATDSDVFGCVADPFCDGDPHYKWQLSISYGTIRARLRKVGIRVSDIKKITIVKKSESGRTDTFGVQTSRGLVEVQGNRFRLALGPEALRSTLIINMKAGKSSVWFEGRGWGHGVGLCQWGARGRALAGQTYKQILETYYPKAKLDKL